MLGRKIELLVEDDRSEADRAAAIYEKLIGQEKVDAVFPPYSSAITEAVAAVTEKHRMPLVSCCGSRTSIFNSSEAGYRREAVFLTLATGIGPAATSLFFRVSIWALNPSRVLAPSRERSPGWAKTTSSTVLNSPHSMTAIPTCRVTYWPLAMTKS